MVGLENYENKKVCECSGGQKQRIAIARVILHDSEIILADELTGSLDKDNRDRVMLLLNERNVNENLEKIVMKRYDYENI